MRWTSMRSPFCRINVMQLMERGIYPGYLEASSKLPNGCPSSREKTHTHQAIIGKFQVWIIELDHLYPR